MITPYTRFLIFTVPSYPYYLALGLLAAAGAAVWLLRGQVAAGRVVDAALSGLVGGVIGARVGHVLLHLPYFLAHPDEIARLSAGGLNWHGALLGGLAGLLIAAWLRGVPALPLLDALAPGLPLLAWAGWTACGALACGYGAEVENLAFYPPPLVIERADIYGQMLPRYDTQTLGALLALALLLLAGVLTWRGWLAGYRFWLLLALFSAGMFALGFLRGDAMPRVGGLRLDQWLDLGLIIEAAVAALLTRYLLHVRGRTGYARTHA